MSYGRYFEEFVIGQEFKHWPGRTITEADCTWFALLTMNQHPLHSDAHYAETYTQHKQRVAMGPLVFSMVIGMSVADISGRAIANLEVMPSSTRSPPSSATPSTPRAACSSFTSPARVIAVW
jgi:acyl dehydratase